MEWKKAPQELTDWLAERMKRFPAEQRPMFGCPTWFHNGNMFASVHGGMIMMRLRPSDQADMMRQFKEVRPFVAVNGRPMKEYVMFSEELFPRTDELMPWFEKGFEFLMTLPAKKTK